MIEEKHTFYN